MTDTKQTETEQPCGVKPDRAAQRAAFEAWLLREQGLTAEWDPARNCYKEFPAHLAYKSWRAAQSEPTLDVTGLAPAPLSPEQIRSHGLALDMQAFRNEEFRAGQGSRMTVPEQEEHDKQMAFARAIENDVREAVAHRLWCAEVNLDGASEHIGELQRENALLRAEQDERSLAAPRARRAQSTVGAACVACEGKPAAGNNPCAVCGCGTAPAAAALHDAILALPCDDSTANEEYSDRRSAYYAGHKDGRSAAAALVKATAPVGQAEGA